MISPVIVSIIAFGLSMIFVPVVRIFCIRKGYIEPPRKDRWHQRPTASFGGIAIFASFVFSLVIAWIGGLVLFRVKIGLDWGRLIGAINRPRAIGWRPTQRRSARST